MVDAVNSDKLTPEAKAEINKYLWRIAAYFGLTNLIAIVAGLTYIFFVLPNQAAEQARAQVQAQSSTLTAEFIKKAAEALVDSGKAQASATQVTEKGREIDRQFRELQVKFDAIKGTSAEQLADLVAKLKATPDLAENLKLVTTVKTLETRLNGTNAASSSQTYGRGAWVNATKSVACPASQIAIGIEVVYGGTCNNQCNGDGGIIQEIKLTCRTL